MSNDREIFLVALLPKLGDRNDEDILQPPVQLYLTPESHATASTHATLTGPRLI